MTMSLMIDYTMLSLSSVHPPSAWLIILRHGCIGIRYLACLHDVEMEDLYCDHTSIDRDIKYRELGVDASQNELIDLRHRQ